MAGRLIIDSIESGLAENISPTATQIQALSLVTRIAINQDPSLPKRLQSTSERTDLEALLAADEARCLTAEEAEELQSLRAVTASQRFEAIADTV
jgi:hypothetical protein